MKSYNFPFSAILGQDNMKMALILNVIDPKIGGVLLTGQQGTGKSTAVRSLQEILPPIQVNEGCQFQCDHSHEDAEAFQCEYCQFSDIKLTSKPINLVNLPLGATEEMVIGSLNIEKIIREGKREIQPGLLARANKGILYVDEINLLQDHLVDILLDVSASGVNLIEREGISLSHPSSFILIGSMNPEEGELRPQISDRLGLEVQITAPNDQKLRAEITQRVLQFSDNPVEFCKLYEEDQQSLREKIVNAKKLIGSVTVPLELYQLASELVIKLGLYSQRADITFIRCARAMAAFRNAAIVDREDLVKALKLVFEHRVKRFKEDVDEEFLGMTFNEVWHKLKPALDEKDDHQPEHPEEVKQDIFKYSENVKNKYQENPLQKKDQDLPEVDGGHRDQKNRYSNVSLDDDFEAGYKAGDDMTKKRVIEPRSIDFYSSEQPVHLDLHPILDFLKQKKRITSHTGRGSRISVLSRTGGRYIYARNPRGIPHNIAFDASIKDHFLHKPHFASSGISENVEFDFPSSNRATSSLAINLKLEDLKEKIFELHAPLSLYFIVDASASMRRTLEQTIKVIQSVHAAGYTKKDKVSIISFQGRDAQILQRPSVSLSVGLQKLRMLEATSYTPLASALKKTMTMIHQEDIKGTSIPVILIMSDLGANVSLRHNDLNAQSSEDFLKISDELDEYARKIGSKQVKIILMKPRKSFATKYLGVNPLSVDLIQNSFMKHAQAKVFEFDAYSPELTIVQLKEILY